MTETPLIVGKSSCLILLRFAIQSWLCFEVAVLGKSLSLPGLLDRPPSMSRMGMCLEWTRIPCVFKAICASVKFILHDLQLYEF